MIVFFYIFILLFQPEELIVEKGSFYNLKKYFKQIPVELQSRTLSIPSGIYGAKQGFSILLEKNFKILKFEEIPLPNLPGKFKFFILNCKKDDINFKAFLILKNYKKKWIVQSFKEIP